MIHSRRINVAIIRATNIKLTFVHVTNIVTEIITISNIITGIYAPKYPLRSMILNNIIKTMKRMKPA